MTNDKFSESAPLQVRLEPQFDPTCASPPRGIVVAMLLLAAVVSLSCRQEGGALRLKIATLDAGSSWYGYGATFAELIRRQLPSGSRIDVLPYAGSIGNPTLIARGEADLGLCMGVTAGWAYHGKFAFDEEHKGLRALAGGLDRYYYAVIARRDLNLGSLREIRDRKAAVRVVTQTAGTLNSVQCFQLLGAYGISAEDIRRFGGDILQTSTDVIAAAMRDGRADLWFQPVTAGHPSVMEVAASIKVKFLRLEPEVIRRLVETYGYTADVLPPGSFPGQEQEIPLIGCSTCLFASERLPEPVAYAAARAVCEGEKQLKAAYKGMAAFEPAKAWDPKISGLPLHPGAERYYREKGYIR